MPNKKKKGVMNSPYSYSLSEGFRKSRELNYRREEEEIEAARKRNAEIRRAAEEKVAKEMAKRKKEMSEEEYRQALDYSLDRVLREDNQEPGIISKISKNLLQRFAENPGPITAQFGVSGALLKPIGAAVDAVSYATGEYIDRKNDKKAQSFLDQFAPDAFAKAQAKYDPVKQNTEVKSSPQEMFAPADTAAFAVSDQNLAQIQRENSELQKQRTQEYKELTKPNDVYVDTLQDLKDTMDARSKFLADTLEQSSFESKVQEEIYGKEPEGWGVSKWWSDAKTQFLINMNTAQRDDFAGRKVALSEMDQKVKEAVLCKKDRMVLQWFLDEAKKRNLSQEERDEVERLKYEIAHIKDSEEYVNQMTPSFPSQVRLDINQTISDLIDRYLPKDLTSGFANDVETSRLMLRHYKNIKDEKSANEFLKAWHQMVEGKMNSWQEGIDKNQEDIDRHSANHKVSDYFQYKERTAQGIFSWQTWFYKQPGLFGSSQSAWLKQSVATGLNFATAFMPGGKAANLIRTGMGAGVTLPMAMSASESENYAELAENYKQSLKNKLASVGLLGDFLKGDKNANDIDEAIEHFVLGKYLPSNPKIMQAAANATYGANAMFQDDMAATTGDDILDTALQLVPFGIAAKQLKASKKATTLTMDARDAFLTGASFGGPIGGTIYSGVRTAFHKTIDDAVDGTVRFMNKVPRKILGRSKYVKTARFFGRNSIPHKVLSPTAYVQYQTYKGYAKEALKRTIKSGISEGGEEGKQYEHGQAFGRGEYRDKGYRGIIDPETILSDFVASIKTAYVMAGMLPFIPATTNDRDLIENIEGGILGGMFQTGAQVRATALPQMLSQMKVNHFVAKQALYEKAQQRDAYEKYKLYAKKAGDSSAISRMNSAFKMYADAVKNNQDKNSNLPDVSMIEQQQDKFNQIVALADSKFMKDAAKQIGITDSTTPRKIGSAVLPMSRYTDRYRQFVALVGMMEDSQEESQQKYNAAAQDVIQLIQKQQSPFRIEGGNVVRDIIDRVTNKKMQEAIAPIEQGGQQISGEGLLELKNKEFASNIELFTNISVLKQLIAEIDDALANRQAVHGTTKDLIFTRNQLKQELQRNLNRIKQERRKDVLDNVDSMLSDVTDLADLKTAIRQKMLLSTELDYHQAVLGGILGEYGKPEEGSEEAEKNLPYSQFNANTLIDQLEDASEEDFKIQENIEKEWLSNFSERSRVNQEEKQKKLQEWRKKMEKKAEERKAASQKTVTVDEEAGVDENEEPVVVPESTFGVDELLPETEKPTATPADNSKPESSYTESQEQAIIALSRKHDEDTERMFAVDPDTKEFTVDRTGHDYFIKDSDGKTRMYGRVHSYLDPQYPQNEKEIQKHDTVVKELTDLWNNKNKNEFVRKALEYEKRFEEEFKDYPGFKKLNVQRYLDYLEDGNESEISDVIEAIADLVSHIPADASVVIGQAIDDACRIFFKTGSLEYSQVEEWMSEDVYNDFVRQLRLIQKQYDDLGWVLIPEPNYFYSQLYDNRTGKVRRVAGETDMIAIDKEGNYHIIDFKTSKNTFHDVYGPGGQKMFNPFTDLKSDRALNDTRRQQRSTKEYYTDQQAMYTIMLQDNLDGAKVVSRELLPFTVAWNKEYENKDTSLGMSFSARTKGEKPIVSIKNEIEATDPTTHEFIMEDGSDKVKMDVQRIQLDMSLTIAERFLDNKNEDSIQDRLQSIIDSSPVDFFYEMSQEDRNKLSSATIDAIFNLADEYNEILDIIASDLFDGNTDKLSIIARAENVISRLEQLQRVADAEIINVEIKEAQDNDTLLFPDAGLITDNAVSQSQQDPNTTLEQMIATQFNDMLQQLEILKNDILYQKYNSPDGIVGGDGITAAEQLISNVRALLSQYPDNFSQQNKEDFDYLVQFFQHELDFQEINTAPNVVDERTEAVIQQDWMGITTTWKATYQDSIGIEDAVAQDGSKLLDVTADPEFITDAVFELTMKKTAGSRGNAVDRVHVIVHYKGKTYTPVAISVANNAQGRAFYNAVRLAIANNPGKRIIIKNSAVSRTNGRIKEVEQGSLVEQGIVNDQNYYTLSYNSIQTQFGVTRKTTDPITGKPITKVQAPGESATQKRTLFDWEGNDIPEAGTLIMMVEPIQNESWSKKVRIPLVLNESYLSEDDAQLVIDILTLQTVGDNAGAITPIQALNREFVEIENGLYIHKGLTNLQVLNLLVPFGPSKQLGKNRVFLSFSANPNEQPTSQQKIYVHGRVKGDPVDQQPREFDITTDSGRQALKQFLCENVTLNIDEGVMSSRIQKASRENNTPFSGLSKVVSSEYGQRKLKAGEFITFGKSRIRFDAKDIQKPNDKTDALGASGIAWYAKCGFIQSRFGGLENTLLNFDNAAVPEVEKQSPEVPTTKSVEEGVQKQNEKIFSGESTRGNAVDNIIDDSQIIDDNVGESFDDDVWNKALKNPNKTFNEKEARGHLQKILGNVPVEIQDAFIDVLSSGAYVVGRTYADAIALSRMGERGVEWHEAFHRVLEILASDIVRNRIYKAYQKMVGDSSLTEKQIGEQLADHFMMYAMNRPAINLKSLKHPFQTIKSWIDFYKSIGSFELFAYFTAVNMGAYRNVKPNAERLAKFKKLYPSGVNMTIGKTGFKHILNEHMYKELRKTMVLLLLQAQNLDPAGRNIQDLQINADIVRHSPIYKSLMLSDEELKKEGVRRAAKQAPLGSRLALEEMLDNWDAVSADIASDISKFSTDYVAKYEEEQTEDADGGEAASASIAEHIRASYEFSQFSRTSSKVRFFFSRIPKCKYVDGKLVQELNELGLPTYYDAKYIFNYVLNMCHDINSKSELLYRLYDLGQTDPIFKLLHQRVAKISGYGSQKISANDQQLMTQIYNGIKTAKNAFVIGKSIQNGDYFSVVIQSTDADYNAQKYKLEWSKLFASGASLFVEVGEDGKLRMKNGYSAKVFTTLAQRLQQIVDCFSDSENPILEIDKQRIKFDKTNPNHVEAAKRSFITILQSLGIQFDYDQLNFTLSKKPYGDTGFAGMQKLLHQTGTNDIAPFIRLLNQLNYKGNLNVDENGNITYVSPKGEDSVRSAERIFAGAGAGFISMLSTAKYNYRTAHDQLQVLATHGNKYYVMSENNVINDITDMLNRASNGVEEDLIEEIKLDVYNYYHPEDPNMIGQVPETGSIVIKKISSDLQAKKEDPSFSPNQVQVVTLAGFKTDEKGDQGNDYAEISLREDYVTKCAILLDGGLMFPTMSDKKTWVYLKGVELPGIDHSSGYLSQTLNSIDENGYFSQLDSVVQQFLEYAQTEYLSVQRTIEQSESLDDSEKVKNFHKATVKIERDGKEIKIPIIQGGRFTSLIGVYDYVTVNGKTERKFIEFNRVLDENGRILNEKDNLKIAEDHFFLPQPKRDDAGNILVDQNANPIMETAEEVVERQKRQIAEVLQHQLIEELKYIEQIGLIKRRPIQTSSSLLSYQNIGLDNIKVEAIARAIAASKGQDWNRVTKKTHEDYMSLATSILVNDIMVKHIMSLQEVERIYSGNPAFFKFVYDNDGHLIDRSIDQLKRFGGLVSTGQPNDMEQDVPSTYRAAEVDNEMVEAANIESLHQLMYEGQIRSTYLRQLLDEKGISIEDEEGAKECAEIADKTPLDKVKKDLDPAALKIAERIAEKKTNSFRMGKYNGKTFDGIDVADGGAYITDEMAENMLKMVGAYDENVKKAFKILRDPSKVHSIREQAEAYNTVWTTVIGTQKYTAYGFRHQNGVQVPYYNKMALFPLFKCMCTGNMAKIYEKMKSDKIDMLMVNSAVKLGSQGSKAIENWDTFESDFHFNPYTQKFLYLRKQFNTDPKEEELMNVGTQMKKIALSAIMPGREYTTLDGRTLSAKGIRDEIMDSINSMSDIGLAAIKDEFFEDGELNVEKFSKFLTDELINRGAGREMLDAVSVIDENSEGISDEQRERIKRTGKKELKVPLVALSNMNWIQSIIVAKINSKVVDTSTQGKAFIQRSVWAMEGRTNVINDENLPEDINGGNDLQMVNDEGSMDCVLSIDFFDHLLPKKIVGYKTKDGQFVLNKQGNRIPIYEKLSFKEARQYLIDNGIIGPKAHSNMVGYRIPTQAISSIHALRCVDVIPVVRDTIILPKEFTKITGSDFDIDKIFLSMKSYSKRDGKLSDSFEDGSNEFYQNRLLDDYIALLCDTVENEDGTKTTRSMHMLHASIDNDTSLLDDVIHDLEQSSIKKPLHSYDSYALRHMCRAKDDFITGKYGIGPYALNNNSQVLTTLYEVEFAPEHSSIMTRLGLNSLHEQFDRNGESIMSWLSGLINIHVDVAKDPKHNKLNINQYTHNLVNLLIRTGFGKDTFYFTTQPILKELATVINNAGGKYMLEKGVSQSKLKKNAEQALIMNIARANGIQGKTFGKVIHNWEQSMHRRYIGINSTIDWLFGEGIEVIRDIARTGQSLTSKKQYEVQTLWDGKPHTEMMSVFDIQMLMYRALKQFTPYAEALSELVKYSKIDTKKQGKNLLEQKKYMRGYKAMFESDSNDKNRMLFKTSGLDRLRDNTYIGNMTENAIGVFNDIMGSQIIQGTDRFIGRGGLVDAVLSAIERFGSTDEQLLRTVSGSILAKIKSAFFNKYAEDNDIDVKGLVDGNNTIYSRLCKLKSEIICTKKYESLRDSNGNIKNYMLATLVAGYTHDFTVPRSAPYGTMGDDYKSVKFINTLNFIDDESIDQDEFIQAWEDLLNDTRFPELQKFAKDLIMYAFITAGDNGGRHDLMKFVPNSWKIQSGYVDEMVRLLDRFNDKQISLDSSFSREDIEDVVLNNWYDDNFVHVVNINNIRPFFSKITQPNGTFKHTQYPTIIGLPDGTGITAEYIKIRRPNISDPESQRNYVLYKRFGYGRHEETVEKEINGEIKQIINVVTYPIYVAVEPRGNKFIDRHLILSYGRQDSSKESLTNMCMDALALKLLVDRGIKVQNTEQALMELSNIFHETDPVVADYIRSLYKSSIQDVIEEYNKHIYAAEDAVENIPEAPENPIPPTAEEAEKRGESVYEVPGSTQPAQLSGESISVAQQLIDHLKSLGIAVHNRAELEQYIVRHGLDSQAFIGKKARTRFEQQLIKARPDLATLTYIVNDIDFIKDPFSDEYIASNISAAETKPLIDAGLIKEGTFAEYALTEKGIKQARESHPQIDAILDFLHSLEDNKENTAYIKTAIRWIANGSVSLPQDHEKTKQAFDVARKKRIDLSRYRTLGDLLASPEMKPKEKEKPKFDPDKAKTFSNKHIVTTEEGRVFTVYDVENTEEGQREVCKALAANYEVSPWCLSTFTNTGEPTQSAKHFWFQVYNALPRKIAFENGRPVAFNSDSEQVGEGVRVFIGGREVPAGIDYRMPFGESSHLDIGTIHWLLDNGYITETRNSFFDEDAYILTPKGEKALIKKQTAIPQREAWWDMEDIKAQSQLSDSIVSTPKKYSRMEDFDEPNLIQPADIFDVIEDARMEFLNRLRDHVRGIIEQNFDLIENLEDNYNRTWVINNLYDAYLRELDYSLAEINPDTDLYTKVQEVSQNNNLEEHIRETINEYYHTRMPQPATPVPPAVNFDDVFDEGLPFFTTSSGEIYGFVTPEGDIYLDETIIDSEHPIHEYTHLWDRVVAQKNPALWKQGIQLMKKTQMWQIIANHPQYGQKWSKTQGITPAQLENMIASEVHSRFVGRDAKANIEMIEKEQGSSNIVDKLIKWLDAFWKTLKDTFSEWTEKDISKLTLKQFNHMTLRDFATGMPLDKNLMKSKNAQFAEQKLDVHGNLYGWSLSSIKDHLYKYVTENVGLSEKARLAHVKKVNDTYGTNFRVYKQGRMWYVLDNTNPKSMLKLSENPNEPKQMSIFSDDQFYIKTNLQNLGKDLMDKCGW